MEIIVDTRQHKGKHKVKHRQLEARGWTLISQKLDHGDYMLPAGRVSIDTKRNIREIYGNLRGRKKIKDASKPRGFRYEPNYPRFRREAIRANDAGHVLVVLIENGQGIHNLADLSEYKESKKSKRIRKAKTPIKGKELAKQMNTISKKYGVLWAFCHPAQTGNKIIEYLSREDELLAHKKKVMVSNEQ